MNLFGRTKDPRTKLNEMTSLLRKEKRPLMRDIRTHLQQQDQLKLAIKKCAKESDIYSAKVYAKEYAESKKAVGRLYLAITHIDSVAAELRRMSSMRKLSNAIEKSTTVMTLMSSLVKMPELQSTMQGLSKQMIQAGIIEDMLNDTLDSKIGLSEYGEDEESDEVDKILWDVTAGQLGKAHVPANDPLSISKAQTELSVLSVDDGESEMNARLDALRS
uniref:SJCHGC01901 protein n=1 Tax=Schistosoma japonicum TaxID=6182 RepID=Q5D9E8_SCHJA|nr:SJCHGC01901 protein [Schistosoma japonicum]